MDVGSVMAAYAIWTIKCVVLLMHGATMKFIGEI
jgi:hypothetical protein